MEDVSLATLVIVLELNKFPDWWIGNYGPLINEKYKKNLKQPILRYNV